MPRQRAIAAVNSELTLLYWRIGQRIHTQVLDGQCAEYGKEIVATLPQQLSWSHFLEILPLKLPLQREYAQMCRVERWSVRTLRARIDSMLYERTALSRKPDELITQELAALHDTERMSADLMMRDPYILDFLGLQDTCLECDLSSTTLALR